MTLSPRAVGLIVGMVIGVVLFPAVEVAMCPSGGGCSSSFETLWGMPLPPGAWSSLPALAVGFVVGWVTYRGLLGRGRD